MIKKQYYLVQRKEVNTSALCHLVIAVVVSTSLLPFKAGDLVYPSSPVRENSSHFWL